MILRDVEYRTNELSIDQKNKVLTGYFEGVRMFIEKMSTRASPLTQFRMASVAKNSFYAFDSMYDAQNTFLDDPHKLIKFVQSELDLMKKEEIGIDHWYDVTGDFLDIGLLLDGEPEHFGNMYMGNPKRVYVTLLLKLDISWSSQVSYLQYYAARILRLIEWLERKEVRTKVIAYSSTEIEHIEILVKDYQDPLTLASIAVLASPDFYRRFVFKAREISPFWNATYGSTEEMDKRILSSIKDLTKGQDSVMLFLDRNIYENNREVTEAAFDSTEQFLQKMLLEEERLGAIIV